MTLAHVICLSSRLADPKPIGAAANIALFFTASAGVAAGGEIFPDHQLEEHMTVEQQALARLIAKEEIRDLALLYSRAIDRKDLSLCRSLYTADGWDTHGDKFDGPADDFVKFLGKGLLPATYLGHHICNHLITVDGNEGEGEVYTLAYPRAPGW